MNTTTLTNGTRVVAQLTDTNGTTEEVTARFIGHWEILPDLQLAHFLIQYDGAMWTNLIATSEDGERWTVAGSTRTLAVRPERMESIATVAENVTGHVTPELEGRIIELLGMDPNVTDGATLIGEEAAEHVYNEIGYNIEETL